MTSEREPLNEALRRMPVPPLRAGFAEEALSRAAAATPPIPRSRLAAIGRWETWMGAAVGAALAVMATVFVMRPNVSVAPDETAIALAMDESRNVEVLIDSERTLEDATIRVATIGAVELDGLDDRHSVEWQTRLERGRNVLSLPVVARTEGPAQLVAVIEHQGRSRRIAIHLTVTPRVRGGNA